MALKGVELVIGTPQFGNMGNPGLWVFWGIWEGEVYAELLVLLLHDAHEIGGGILGLAVSKTAISVEDSPLDHLRGHTLYDEADIPMVAALIAEPVADLLDLDIELVYVWVIGRRRKAGSLVFLGFWFFWG